MKTKITLYALILIVLVVFAFMADCSGFGHWRRASTTTPIITLIPSATFVPQGMNAIAPLGATVEAGGLIDCAKAQSIYVVPIGCDPLTLPHP
jgi:hypothetical protein